MSAHAPPSDATKALIGFSFLAVCGSFGFISLLVLSTPKAIPPEPKLAPYVSPSNFQPFNYREEQTVIYTMMDIMPEDGDTVRWLDKTTLRNYNGYKVEAGYAYWRSNCKHWTIQLIGAADSPDKTLNMNFGNGFDRMVPATQQMNGSFEACRRSGKVQ